MCWLKHYPCRRNLYGHCLEVRGPSIYSPCSFQPQKGTAEITCFFTYCVPLTGPSRRQPWLQSQVGEKPSSRVVLMAPRSEHGFIQSTLFLKFHHLIYLFPIRRAELRPAELYFQMHLLATQSSAATSQQNQLVETMQTPEKWLLRAIHLNPSCSRYWTALMQLVYV